MSFAQGAPTQPLVLQGSNVFLYGSSTAGNAFTVQQLSTGNVASFQTSTSATALIINPAGNVGIGKTNPAYALDVAGNINVSSANVYVNGASISTTTGQNLFVAVSTVLSFYSPPEGSNIAASSTDGITWTARTLPSTAQWGSVTVNRTTGVFVAIADGATAASSTDGINWTARTLPSSAQQWTSVTVNPTTGVFVAVALTGTDAAYSTDGITWIASTLPSSLEWVSVTVNPTTGVFVAVAQGTGVQQQGTNIAASSTDGITWTARTLPSSTFWRSVTVNPTTGVFVAVAIGGTAAASSTDGITWTARTLPGPSFWFSVTVNPTTGVFVAVAAPLAPGMNQVAASSTDGITWTARTLPGPPRWISVTVNPTTGVFVAAAGFQEEAAAASSTDGINWTARTLPTAPSLSWVSVTSAYQVTSTTITGGTVVATTFSGSGASLTGTAASLTSGLSSGLTGTPNITVGTVGGTTITASTQFSGPGTGLTGTATSFNVGGSAGSLSTTYTAGRILYGAGSGVPTTVSTLFYDSTNSRLGIGTASPSKLLHVWGGMIIGASSDSRATTVTLNAPGATTTFSENSDIGDGARIMCLQCPDLSSTTANLVSFSLQVAPTGSFGTQRTSIDLKGFRVASQAYGGFCITSPFDSGGSYDLFYTDRTKAYFQQNVGIGTANPTGPLDVYQSVNGQTGIRITNANTGTAAVGGLALGTNDSANRGGIAVFSSTYIGGGGPRASGTYVYCNGAGGLTLAAEGANNVFFLTNYAERMRIASSGNVGIGTLSPGYKLDVAGPIRSSQLALVGYTNIVNRRPIYIATSGSPLSFNLTNTVGASAYIIYNYGPFIYAIPAVATGATRYYRMYMVYSDNGTVGTFALQYNFDSGGGSQQYSFGITFGGGAGSNNNRDSYSQNVTLQSGNHGTLYVVLTQNVFPNGGGNWGITIQYIELQALDVY